MCVTCVLHSLSCHFQYFDVRINLVERLCPWLVYSWQTLLTVFNWLERILFPCPLCRQIPALDIPQTLYVLNGKFFWVFLWQRSNFEFFSPLPHGFVLLPLYHLLINLIILVYLLKFSPSTSVLTILYFQLAIQGTCIQFAKVLYFFFNCHPSMTSLFEGRAFTCFLNVCGVFFLKLHLLSSYICNMGSPASWQPLKTFTFLPVLFSFL